VIARFGAPTTPITISRNCQIERQAEVNIDNQNVRGD
jgi:hypothetical protein